MGTGTVFQIYNWTINSVQNSAITLTTWQAHWWCVFNSTSFISLLKEKLVANHEVDFVICSWVAVGSLRLLAQEASFPRPSWQQSWGSLPTGECCSASKRGPRRSTCANPPLSNSHLLTPQLAPATSAILCPNLGSHYLPTGPQVSDPRHRPALLLSIPHPCHEGHKQTQHPKCQ